MAYAIHYVPTGTNQYYTSLPFDDLMDAVRMVELLHKENELSGCGCSIINVETGKTELCFQVYSCSLKTRWTDFVADYRIKTWDYYLRNYKKIRVKAYQKKLAEVEERIAREERERTRIKQELEKLGL